MKLSEKLAQLKTENGLTTDALSLQSGVPKGTINKILNGETRNPTVGTLAALARALGCPLESLSDRAELPLAPGRIPGVGRLRDLLGRWRGRLRRASSQARPRRASSPARP